MPCANVELYSKILSAWTDSQSLSILIVREDSFFFLPKEVTDNLSFGNATKGLVLLIMEGEKKGCGGFGGGHGHWGVTELRYLLIFPLTDNEGCFWLVEGSSHRLPNTDWEAIQAQLKTLLGRVSFSCPGM